MELPYLKDQVMVNALELAHSVLEGLSSRDNAGNGLEMFGGDQKICVTGSGSGNI